MRSNDQIDKNRNLTDRHFNANIVSVKKCFVVLLRVINFIMESSDFLIIFQRMLHDFVIIL